MNIEALTLFNSSHKTKRASGASDDSSDHDALSSSALEDDEMVAPHLVSASQEDDVTRTSQWATERAGETNSNGHEHTRSEPALVAPEVLSRQPMVREDLDAKLKAMLASSTSRLETSLHHESSRVSTHNSDARAAALRNSMHGASTHAGGQSRHRSNSASSASLLRSAEMVNQHMIGSNHSPMSSLTALQSYLPASQSSVKAKAKPDVKHQVEMEFLRSTIGAGRPVSVASRPRSSTTSAAARSPLRSSSSFSTTRFKM